MEYSRHQDYENYIDDPSLAYEFRKLSINESYVALNRDLDASGVDDADSTLMAVDVNRSDVYRFRMYEDVRLRESSEERLTREERIVIEEGYLVYNRGNMELSYAGIHRVNGANYTYQIKYIYRNYEFQPQLISYVDVSATDITMRLDKDMNIIQVYSDYVPHTSTEPRVLGTCPVGGSDSVDSGVILVGSKNVDIMVSLTYIISNEITMLRKLGNLMIDLGYLSDYVIT